MAKIGRLIKFVIRLTPEERTRLEGMIHCGIGALNSALYSWYRIDQNSRCLIRIAVQRHR